MAIKNIGDNKTAIGSCLNWHHDLSQVTGALVLDYTAQRFERSKLKLHAATLNRIAGEMETMSKQKGGESEISRPKKSKGMEPNVSAALPAQRKAPLRQRRTGAKASR